MNLERLKDIANGEKVVSTFSITEMESRLTALRKQMADDGLDAVVFTSYHNINYYSDFLYTYFGRSYAMVVTQTTADHGLGQHRRRHALATQLRRQRRLHRLAPRQLRIRRPAGAGAPSGIGKRPPRRRGRPHRPDLPAQIQAALARDATLSDVAAADDAAADDQVAEEIELIKHGARIGDLGGEAIRDAITEGVTEYEVAIVGIERHDPRDRPHLPARRTARHLGVVPVRHQHRRRPQLGHQPPGAARTTSCRSTASR